MNLVELLTSEEARRREYTRLLHNRASIYRLQQELNRCPELSAEAKLVIQLVVQDAVHEEQLEYERRRAQAAPIYIVPSPEEKFGKDMEDLLKAEVQNTTLQMLAELRATPKVDSSKDERHYL